MDSLQAVMEVSSKRTKLHSSLVRWVRNHDDIEDIIQRTLMRMLAVRSPIDCPDRYAYQIARRIIYEDMTSPYGRSRAVTTDEVEQIDSEQMRPEDEIDLEQRVQHILDRLRAVNVKGRACFIMSRFEGYTYREIADQLSISPSMVKKYLDQAERKVAMTRDQFERAKAMYEYARQDRKKAEETLRKAEAEEARRAEEFAQVLREGLGHDGTGTDRSIGSATGPEPSAAEILGVCASAG